VPLVSTSESHPPPGGWLCDNPTMPFDGLDTAAVARALSQIADRPGDRVDAFFERLEEVELPPEEEAAGLRVRREDGFAVRLVRGGQTWLAARDGLDPAAFSHALRQVARALPAAPYGEPSLGRAAPEGRPDAGELAAFIPLVRAAVRRHHAAFPLHLSPRRHRREVQVVGPRLVPALARERFYSVTAHLPWTSYGTLLAELGAAAAEGVAAALVASFRARQAAPPPAGRVSAVLAPEAAAVLLHEAVAHALEADVLAFGGKPEAAVGLALGPEGLHVLDDPAHSPGETARSTDDEGCATTRRWLLRDGVVEQPLADTLWADRSDVFLPGAGRRGDRGLPPGPRSTCLELSPGESSVDDLLAGAEGGLSITQVRRGHLDPSSGRFTLEIPFARRIRGGVAAEAVGPFRIRGTVADLLAAIIGRGKTVEVAGAGWCAKGGQKLPVWARTPAVLLATVEVRP